MSYKYKKLMKAPVMIGTLLLAAMLICGCAAKPVAESDMLELSADGTLATATSLPAITPQPRMTSADRPANSLGAQPQPAATPQITASADGIIDVEAEPVANGTPKVTVTDGVAYLIEDGESRQLYAAIEYKNTGSAPMIITACELTLECNGRSAAVQPELPLAQYDIVAPDESGYIVYYGDAALLELQEGDGGAVTVSAELSCAIAEGERQSLRLSNLYLVKNYPRFATLTGTIDAGSECDASLNMLYVGFYDEAGKLIAVYNFTQNAVFENGGSRNFTRHMRGLNIEGLTQNTASMRGVGFAY